MIDMSSTLIHHGHIRLIKKARKYGDLTIGLTTDKQIKKHKGYFPELNYKFRREILSEIKGVKKIVPSDWLITQKFLDKHKIDILISGGDYKNRKFKIKTIHFERTKSISSTMLRQKAAKILLKKYEK
tara:strand:+ start:365 stop:748 length:384 start_codon:yes stop_codon:yes gene_type:complete